MGRRRSVGLSGVVFLSVLVLAACVGLSPWMAAQERPGFKVVVNVANPIRELPRHTIADMYLYKVKRWENGGSRVEEHLVEPVDQPDDSPLWEEFSLVVHRKKPTLLKRYWMKVIFSGDGKPPLDRNGDEAMLAYIGERVAAIGYVSTDAKLPPNVRELRVIYEKK